MINVPVEARLSDQLPEKTQKREVPMDNGEVLAQLLAWLTVSVKNLFTNKKKPSSTNLDDGANTSDDIPVAQSNSVSGEIVKATKVILPKMVPFIVLLFLFTVLMLVCWLLLAYLFEHY